MTLADNSACELAFLMTLVPMYDTRGHWFFGQSPAVPPENAQLGRQKRRVTMTASNTDWTALQQAEDIA